MRKPIIIGNWKMNNTLQESIDLVNGIKNFDLDCDVDKVVCVPFIYAMEMKKILENTDISVGVQNFYFENSGAYTGEISATMLNSIGVEFVIIGHFERRTIFGETDELINEKLLSALNNNLKPILCCGESKEERENNIAKEKIESQIKSAFNGVDVEKVSEVIIAYEPIWAIGTGLTASAEDAEDMISFIRSIVKELYGEISNKVRIQYGGSVKPENIKEIMSKENIDGALVGGACLKAESYRDLVNYKK